MTRFSSIFLPFLVNQTQKHKLISHKSTNTNPAIDLSCQPNTNTHKKEKKEKKKKNTYPKINKKMNTNTNLLSSKTLGSKCIRTSTCNMLAIHDQNIKSSFWLAQNVIICKFGIE